MIDIDTPREESTPSIRLDLFDVSAHIVAHAAIPTNLVKKVKNQVTRSKFQDILDSTL